MHMSPVQLPQVSISSTVTVSNIPLSESPLSSTNGELLAYCVADYGAEASKAKLKILIVNVNTGVFTRISTGITRRAERCVSAIS